MSKPYILLAILMFSFFDQNNNPYLPNSGKYKITDKITGTIITDWTEFTPEFSVYTTLLTSEENSLVNPALDLEVHVITLTVYYGENNCEEENAEVSVTIQNLVGIT
jgi:hypothetical protein